MIIVVGLGNPSKKFEKTRHNLGFQVVEEFRKTNNFPDFRFVKKSKAEIGEGKINNEKVILAKPHTFMNESGKAVKNLIRNWKLEIRNLIVIHDDLDLPLGKIRIVKNRGAAGHKGVQSIIDELGTKNFVRFRVGIKPINSEQRTINNIENFVLQKFNKKEEKILKKVIRRTCQAIEIAIIEEVEKVMQEFNK